MLSLHQKSIHRKQSPLTYKAIRRISLLPVLGKILESFMGDWLCDFLAPYLGPKSVWWLKTTFHKTTTHALVCILHSWCSTLDQGGSVRALFVDFTKAFDRVDHNIGLLLTKLKDRGIPHCLVKWFHLYLCFRCQTVRVDTVTNTLTGST